MPARRKIVERTLPRLQVESDHSMYIQSGKRPRCHGSDKGKHQRVSMQLERVRSQRIMITFASFAPTYSKQVNQLFDKTGEIESTHMHTLVPVPLPKGEGEE